MQSGEHANSDVLGKLLSYQKRVTDIRQWRQLEAIWLREKLGLPGPTVAEALNYNLQTVHLLWHRWRRQGLMMFENKRRPGGRNHAYLSVSEEELFLEDFLAMGESGQVLTVEVIQRAYEERVGRKVSPSTVYRLLRRNGWRKVAPRKKHPKSDPAIQEELKKTDPGGKSGWTSPKC